MSLVSFYSQEELEGLGLRHLGRDVRISRMARLYNPAGLAIGDHSRIDDFCILTGDIFIGRNVHVSAFGALHGSQGIRLEDFSCVSGRVSIYTESDDYTSGQCLTNATVPEPFRHIEDKGPVRVARHGLVGCGSVLLPGTTVGEGATVGALSLVRGDLDPWFLYLGVPARKRRPRPSAEILRLEAEFLAADPPSL